MSFHSQVMTNFVVVHESIDKTILSIVGLLLVSLMFWIALDLLGITSPAHIKGLPLVPSYPILGSLPLVKRNSFLKYCEWASKYGEVFQMRLGTKIVIVANSFQSIQELWVKNGRANNSRPQSYSFHELLSQSKVYTVGTTPFSETYLRKKKFLSYSLNKKSIDQRSDVIDIETSNTIFPLFEQSLETGTNDFEVLRISQYFTLRTALIFTYGYFMDTRLEGRKLADEIIDVENAITGVRAHTSNWQDYLPILRWLSPRRSKEVSELRERRSRYLQKFYEYTRQKLVDVSIHERAAVQDCLVARVLGSNKGGPASNNLDLDEITSVCLTMLSAGLDNTGFNFAYCIGQLSHDKNIQITGLQQIKKCYGDNLQMAWNNCAYDMKCDYIKAIVKETLRQYTVLPVSLPRETTKDISYRGTIIPAGTTMFMNSWAGNHDPKVFKRTHEFIPERFLNEDLQLLESCEGLTHFSFGAGTRMCTGSYLAFREMYTLLCKFIIAFEITLPEDPEMVMERDPVKLNRSPEAIAFEPRPFKVGLRIRDQNLVLKLLDQYTSEKRFLNRRFTVAQKFESEKTPEQKALDTRIQKKWDAYLHFS
ncbi:unnamed protein product [Kuraishia capsulata CBS 1993]|uniref:Phenylacetate 2-hydroxylase n=1 Tax=Kuraishia capsulata CBS 1993 TaxID=1382522 RepID=W6MJR6_9ASCO|nr:uncharacterized protein KUCA_T00002483001 [Kuraishia capsulata CBS 1993]CDK26511.1 unnamed protein product [Kuraishia capsulata CBS 1993]